MVRRNSEGIYEKKTLFWIKKITDQAGFKGTGTRHERGSTSLVSCVVITSLAPVFDTVARLFRLDWLINPWLKVLRCERKILLID